MTLEEAQRCIALLTMEINDRRATLGDFLHTHTQMEKKMREMEKEIQYLKDRIAHQEAHP